MSLPKDRDAHGAENMEIAPHGPSNPGFEPATFQSQVQHSTDWATGAPLERRRERKKESEIKGPISFIPFIHFNLLLLWLGDSQDEEEEAQAVSVTAKFSRPESVEAKARREATYEHYSKCLGEEPWKELDYYGLNVSDSFDDFLSSVFS